MEDSREPSFSGFALMLNCKVIFVNLAEGRGTTKRAARSPLCSEENGQFVANKVRRTSEVRRTWNHELRTTSGK